MGNTNIYTMEESCTLPSKGLIYNPPINPDIKLRAMNVMDEMKRLSGTTYSDLCDLIEGCIVGEPPMHVRDMCLGDYQYLLHRLRVVTYGKNYKMTLRCPSCGGTFDAVCDLDSLEIFEYDPKDDDLKTVTLPVSKKVIELRVQTPKILDDIAKEKKARMDKNPGSLIDQGFVLSLMSCIKSIDGQVISPVDLEDYVRHMDMRDANLLFDRGAQLNERVGLNTTFKCQCTHCKYETEGQFRITPEFFRPTTD